MHAATRFGLRFAYAAAVVVAIGTAVAELTVDASQDLFAPLPFGVTSAVFAIGTFVWSYMVAAGSAWHLKGMESSPEAHPLMGGIAFALLTPVVGLALSKVEFPTFAVTMFGWVLLFPVLVVLASWWRSRAYISPERAGD